MDDPDGEKAGFKYTPDDKSKTKPNIVVGSGEVPPQNTSSIDKEDEPLFNWSAKDSFSMSKDFLWYLMLLVITIGVAAAIYFITKDKITTGVILFSGLLIGIYAAKKPKVVNYQLTKYGFTINGRYYQFGNYRSFSIVHHGDARSVVLTPLKRFMPYMYIYFGSDIEQQITTALTDVLPIETAHADTIDRVLRKIGF